MNSKKIWQRVISLASIAALTVSAAVPAFAGSLTGDQLPKPGEDGYASIHEYINPTDDPNVFKVTLSVKGADGPVYDTRVVAVIDNSSTMNTVTTASGSQYYDTDSILMNRWDWAQGASPKPSWWGPGVDWSDLFASQIIYPRWPSDKDGATRTAWSTTDPFKWSKPYANTRLDAAVKGAQSATKSFLTLSGNPGAERTSFGVVGFSDAGSIQGEAATGFNISLPYDVGLMTGGDTGYGYGDAWNNNGSNLPAAQNAITYSTRIDPDYAIAKSLANTGGIWIAATAYGKSILDRSLTKHLHGIIADPKSTAEEKALAYGGLVAYDEAGKGREYLIKDLSDNIYASTMSSYTDINSGLAEAETMLYSTGQISPGNVVQAKGGMDEDGWNGVDHIRRYVIFLSDGADNGGFIQDTMQRINRMKANGTEFMVIGIDTEGATDDNGKVIVPSNTFSKPTDPGPDDYVTHTTGPHYGQFLSWMGSKMKSYSGAAYGAWSTLDPFWGGPPYVTDDYTESNWTGKINYKYLPGGPNLAADIQATFQEYVDQIIFFGHDAKVDFKLSTEFDIYQYPGKPKFEFSNSRSTMKQQGGNWVWDLGMGIPKTEEVFCSFYVKINKDITMDGTFYSVLEKAVFSVIGPFPIPGQKKPVGGWLDSTGIWNYSTTYVSPTGGIKSDEQKAEEQAAVEAVATPKEPETIAAALPIVGGLGSAVARGDAEITGIEAKQLKTGKTQVSVSVKNGSEMYYQWQRQDGKDWIDIPGANSSTYTLTVGKTFKAGQKYKLRCVVSNAMNKKFYSDVIEATATKSSTSGEKLQSGN